MAKKPPVERLTDKEFDSMDDAAAWVSSVFNPLSIEDDREFGGGIIKNPKTGKFYVTYNPGEEGKVEIRVLKPKDHKLEGFWHSHGGRGAGRRLQFSQGDAKTVKKTKLPFYMVGHDGALKILRPGKKDPMGFGEDVRGADGNPIVVRTAREQRLFEPVRLPPGALISK